VDICGVLVSALKIKGTTAPFPFDCGNVVTPTRIVKVRNWSRYQVYYDENMAEAGRKYGRLHKGKSVGWGIDVISFFAEEQAREFREDYSDAA